MIDEILTEIREAETKADYMQSQAYQQAKDIVLRAEMEADKQKKDIVKTCKADQRNALSKAEKKALDRRNFILAKGQTRANELIEQHSSTVDEVSSRLVADILEKY